MKTIDELLKEKCCGCGACFQSCPVNAIEMKQDHEGFYYPVVQFDKCISCGKCVKTCPALKEKKEQEDPKCYAVSAADGIRKNSSSGGVFTLLAEEVLSHQGVVCGAVLDDDFVVRHKMIHSIKELPELRGSKYVQSNLGNSYKEVEASLKEGKEVLFTGTPCQVAGLKAYLKTEQEKLLTAEILCHGVASPLAFDRYLEENYGKENIEKFTFRTKEFGHNCMTAIVELKNGKRLVRFPENDMYELGFHRSIFLRPSCASCKYAEIPRAADITMGDFWGIEKYKKELQDNGGISVVLLNTEKGREYGKVLEKKAKVMEEVPAEAATKHNRFSANITFHPRRDNFFRMLSYSSFNKAVKYTADSRYDVGILGVWHGLNYGSTATYYALAKVLEEMGLSVLMIDKIDKPSPRGIIEENPSREFFKKKLAVSKPYRVGDLGILNNYCDAFVVGSDQVWNYGVCRNFGRSFLMDFARPEKKKVAVACSFGHARDFRPERERLISMSYFQKFDAISVREDSAVDIMKKTFGIEATQVLDPVFVADRKIYDEIADEARPLETEKYMLCYILDPTPEKKAAADYLSKKLGLEPYYMLDGVPWVRDKNIEKLGDEKILEDITFPEWLNYIRKADYVLTDSCHGMSFALIFQREFAAIGNTGRGMPRFASLTKVMNVEHRFVTNADEIVGNEKFLEPVNYTAVQERMETEKEKTKKWIHKAMFSDKKTEVLTEYKLQAIPSKKAESYLEEQTKAQDALPREIYKKLPPKTQTKIKHWIKKHLLKE